MMPDDIPHTDDKAKRKIHPGAKICLIISLVLVALLVCGFVLIPLYYSTELTYDMGDPYPFTKYDKLIDVSSLISLCTQPFGILLGIYALVQIKKDGSYCGKGYAIAGISISILQVAGIAAYIGST